MPSKSQLQQPFRHSKLFHKHGRQGRGALAPILESVGQSFQVNESIRRLAQEAAAYNVATPSLSEVLRAEKDVHIGPYQELADDSTKGAYVLHEELLSYLKRNRTEAGVITVLMVLVSYLGNKDEIFESAGEHAAGIQQALETLWNFAVDLLVWLGRTTS